MESYIISKEIIKPSSPTPHHLKTYKLSLIDQLSLDNCYGFLLFYPKVDKNISDHLKKSLSKALTIFYPFAGRVQDDFLIDCDDSGVSFVEAHVAINMSEVLRKPEMNILEILLPCNPNKMVSTTRVNFAFQLNYFDCGGAAICVSLRHVIADGSALANFLKTWAAIARGSSVDNIKDVIFDCASIFPPNELATNVMRNTNEKRRSINCITKRFTFDGTKIAALREKIKSKYKLYCPTRFEIVTALIWGALISMARQSGDAASPLMVIPLNVRKRMNPPIPQQCIGNVIYWVAGNWLDNEEIDYSSLANKIHQLVEMVNDDDVRKYYNGDGLANQLSKESEEFINDATKLNVFSVSSLCGLPFYEADFGWGKPTWASIYLKTNNVASLVDSSDGKGVEAWVGLSKKDMAKFERDLGILTCSSFDPIAIHAQSKL
ncbi:Transferase [Melia azedarach]|uniref:Transferase n=1 Tax=Melia azedarach TaxID=155640 RepID=A0ACC1XSB8_MELAZ|nr:Transferase [Melia azedarach]